MALHRIPRGLSFLELLAAVTIMGIIAMIAIPRFSQSSDSAKRNACAVNRGNIEVQAQLFFRQHGRWPNNDLSDIFANRTYFPDGPVTCPVTPATSYTFDSTTQRVSGHAH